VLIVTTTVVMLLLLLVLYLLIHLNSKTQRHLFNLANFDKTSGLPNRNYLFTLLEREIDNVRQREYPFAVLFYDLDNFKMVNDAAGHDVGDELLFKIANFLDSFAKKSDYAFVNNLYAFTARIGGDEFLQLIPGISSVEEAAAYAQKILGTFAEELDLRRFIEEFGVGLSIGVSLFPSMETDYDELIKFADIAMYHAKYGGKNDYRVYEISMGDDVEGAELTVRKGSR
jgi:diguanylate cyclase (GGDEF)-like protein